MAVPENVIQQHVLGRQAVHERSDRGSQMLIRVKGVRILCHVFLSAVQKGPGTGGGDVGTPECNAVRHAHSSKGAAVAVIDLKYRHMCAADYMVVPLDNLLGGL
jgi:hypothetical protein